MFCVEPVCSPSVFCVEPVCSPSDTSLSVLAQSGGGSPQSQRPAELSDDEVGELFQRLAEVQQEKWMLEEKVRSPLCHPSWLCPLSQSEADLLLLLLGCGGFNASLGAQVNMFQIHY